MATIPNSLPEVRVELNRSAAALPYVQDMCDPCLKHPACPLFFNTKAEDAHDPAVAVPPHAITSEFLDTSCIVLEQHSLVYHVMWKMSTLASWIVFVGP